MLLNRFPRVPTIWVIGLVFAVVGCETSDSGASNDTIADIVAETKSDAASGPECEEVAEFVQIAACMVQSGEETDNAVIVKVEYSAEGTVLEVGEGMPPDNCFQDCHIGGCLDEQSMSADARWVRFEDADGAVWTAAFMVPFEQPWVSTGDDISVKYDYQWDVFAPDMGRLEVRKDNDLVVWLGVGGTPGALETPEGISLTTGDAVCQDSDDCGSWAWYLLDVAVGDLSGTAGYKTAPLNIVGYQVLNAGIKGGTSEEVQCLDWVVDDARVAIWPGE